ncbi:uncharacterized protein LOC143850221 [Tasmannia lanceolata]|uniref:uncharacterized protein LOC143850221 n=1 Tax=Tasmannia lanceolata TaxID=3420 RepID=UPI00406305C9
MRSVVGLIDRQGQPQPPPVQHQHLANNRPHQTQGITEFMRLAPRIFMGTTNVQDAELWLSGVEKAFRAMNCVRDVEKIRYAKYMLEGNALHWWEGIVQLNEDIEEPYTWADFRADFLDRYFPHSTLYQMQRDFIELSQGERTVEEYEIEFDRLSSSDSSGASDDESAEAASSDHPESTRTRTFYRAAEDRWTVSPNSFVYPYRAGCTGGWHCSRSATHSFISGRYVDIHDIITMPMESELSVSTPMGGSMMSNKICRMCPIRIGERELLAELIVLPMHDFDVILGMDWLSSHYATVKCHEDSGLSDSR